MSTTYVEPAVQPASVEAAAYGGFVDAIGGIATIVLAIVALAGIAPQQYRRSQPSSSAPLC